MSEVAKPKQYGYLAELIGRKLPVQVCQSRAGFYIGTITDEGLPCSRESAEYWRNRTAAEKALSTGGWVQRREP